MGLPFQHALEEIRLIQFRCFESLVFRPDNHFNLIVGPNAQGKTSLLEAICVLLRLQSPRTSIFTPLISHGRGGFSLEGTCSGRHLQVRYEMGVRKLRVDSVEQKSPRTYLSVGRVAWFANSDGELIRGGSGTRRRYLDFMGSQIDPNYMPHLRAYERAWRSRNFLLKEGAAGKEIHAFDKPLVTSGEALATCRQAIVDALKPLFSQAVKEISGKEEAVTLHYERGFQSDFHQELLASESEERRFRHTLVGVHRDELRLLLGGEPAVTFASEGQQRTIALSLKLAQVRLLTEQTNAAPILLLDDIFGELDAERRRRLLENLPKEAQKILTTTDLRANFGDISDIAIFEIAQNQLYRKK
ncbi:MAG: hypothetical protein C5B47_07620 [Verrucomicrobia bacterium]|nr:MAG: hypothetical protein C5B47_07620 [Verrucomicrobiota bacterium]